MAEPARSGILGMMISQRQFEGSDASGDPLVMPEDDFCRRLCAYGQTLGMLVFLFCASQAAASTAKWISGYRLHEGEWQAGSFPLPDVVYDRSLPSSTGEARRFQEALKNLQQRKRFVLLNGSLPGKLDVYTALQHNDQLFRWLPETQPYRGADQLQALLARYPCGLFLKPAAGMHGKGAFRLLAREQGWQIDGRDRSNRPLTRHFQEAPALFRWITRFVSAALYLVQPCLELTDEEGRSFDVRALMQKDAGGHWSFTGAAVRQGGEGSITSNLHGGGTAVMAMTALKVRYGESGAAKLLERIHSISERASACLEQHFGRLAELGLDFGLEPGGRLWLLEANSKPGRHAFDSDADTADMAVRRPIDYALLLASRQRPVFPSTRIQRRYIQEVHP